MADNKVDYFPELGNASSNAPVAPTASGKVQRDYFPELDQKGATAAPGLDIGKEAQVAGVNAATGAFSPIEDLVNAVQFGHRHAPGLFITPGTQMFPDLSGPINAFNRLTGAAPQPYMDVTNAPMFGGQTARQFSEGHPVSSMLGNLAGALPYGLIGGGAAAPAAKLGTKMAANALKFGGINAGFGAATEAGQQIKNNDTLNPQQIGMAGLVGGGLGAITGAGTELAGAGTELAAAGIAKYQAGKVAANQARNLKLQQEGVAKAQREAVWGGIPHPPDWREWDQQEAEAVKEIHAQNPLMVRGEPVEGAAKARQKAIQKLHAERDAYVEEHFPEVAEYSRRPLGGPSNISTEGGNFGWPAKKPVKRIKGEEAAPSEVSQSTTAGSPYDFETGASKKAADLKELKSYVGIDSWRGFRNLNAKKAKGTYAEDIKPIGQAKYDLDEADAFKESAVEQYAKQLKIVLRQEDEGNKTRRITPEQWQQYLHPLTQAMEREPVSGSLVVESTLQTPLKRNYTFKSKPTDLEGRAQEVNALSKRVAKLDKDYQAVKAQNFDKVQREQQYVKIKDAKVNIRKYANVNEWDYKVPEDKLKLAAEKARLAEIAPSKTEYSTAALKEGIRNQFPGEKGEVILKVLNSRKGPAVLAAIGAAYAVAMGQQKAEAAPEPPPRIVGKAVLEGLRQGWEGLSNYSPFLRGGLLESNTDILLKGYDSASRTFVRKRMTYLAGRRRSNFGAREMTEAETEVYRLKGKIGLKDWTAEHKARLSRQEREDEGYKKLLAAEKKRVDKAYQKNGFFGPERYRAMLEHDERMMGMNMSGKEDDRLSDVASKLKSNFLASTFKGNQRAAGMHALEAMVAVLANDPQSTGEALHGLVTNPVYQEFAVANSPVGMFQQSLNKGKKFGWQKEFDTLVNDRITDAIKKLPHGEAINQLLEAQLPERAKLGAVALVEAQRLGKVYYADHGGPEQYMQDWLASAKHDTPVPSERAYLFAEAETDRMISENQKIMLMPEGPITEMTIFDRHRGLGILRPLLRAQITQARMLAHIADGTYQSILKGDIEGTTKGVGKLLLAHVLIASAAGSAVLPWYMWSTLEHVDKTLHGNTRAVDNLKKKIDELQSHVAGGYQNRDFGPKYMPAFGAPTILLGSMLQRDLRAFNFKKDQIVLNAVVDALLPLIPSVGNQGTLNMKYLAEQMLAGMAGHKEYAKYGDNFLMNMIQGRPFDPKDAHQRIKYSMLEGMKHWLAKIENPEQVKVILRGEEVERRRNERDLRQIQQNAAGFARRLTTGKLQIR